MRLGTKVTGLSTFKKTLMLEPTHLIDADMRQLNKVNTTSEK